MKRFADQFRILWVLVVTALAIHSGNSQTGLERTQGRFNDGSSWENFFVPPGVDDHWDYSDSPGNTAVGQILVAGGTDPSIDIMTEASGAGYSGGAAWMDVGITTTTSAAGNVPPWVPIIIKGAYSLSGSAPFCDGSADIKLLGGWGTGYSYTMWSASFNNSSSEGPIVLHQNVGIGATVYYQYECAGEAQGGESQCVLDPIIEIDPTATVLYNGNYVPATSLYQLSYSPGVDPPTVPDGASTLFLSVVSLAALWSFGRVKAVRRLG
jgi:hypothetical protein